MIVYNVTVVVDPEVHDEWKSWMKSVHLPEVLSTGRFVGCSMFRINPMNTEEDPSYSIQYQAESMEIYELYAANEAPALKQQTQERYGEKVLAFRTILEHEISIKP